MVKTSEIIVINMLPKLELPVWYCAEILVLGLTTQRMKISCRHSQYMKQIPYYARRNIYNKLGFQKKKQSLTLEHETFYNKNYFS